MPEASRPPTPRYRRLFKAFKYRIRRWRGNATANSRGIAGDSATLTPWRNGIAPTFALLPIGRMRDGPVAEPHGRLMSTSSDGGTDPLQRESQAMSLASRTPGHATPHFTQHARKPDPDARLGPARSVAAPRVGESLIELLQLVPAPLIRAHRNYSAPGRAVLQGKVLQRWLWQVHGRAEIVRVGRRIIDLGPARERWLE